MKPVKQKDFEQGGGCFRACIASLLEVTYEDVPEFNDDWYTKYNEWLIKRGYYLLMVDYWVLIAYPPVYYIAGGPSPRSNPNGHAIIRYENDDVFDPHPDNTFLEGIPEQVYFLIPIDKKIDLGDSNAGA